MSRNEAIAILQKDLQNFCEAKECWESYGVEIMAERAEMKIEAYKMAIYALGGATV